MLQLHLIAELTISSPFSFELGASHFESLDSTPISGIVDEPSSILEAWLTIGISAVSSVNTVSTDNFLSEAQNISSNFNFECWEKVGY